MNSPIRKKPLPMRDNTDTTPDRKGKGKEKVQFSAFEALPREIIQEILYAADPNTFDSLTLVNSKWHQASKSPRLYAHQLKQCGATDVPEEPTDDSLPGLIRMFTAKARRELFETMLRPRVTEIQLICEASSSAAAFPGGEAFRFEFSPKGTHLLALSSSRIFVLDLSVEEICVKRELKISRRPVCAAIVDDGSVLAVLSSNHTVALYDLTQTKAQLIKSIPLENAPRTIALSPGAEVLGAAYNGGIEVYSLLPDALPTDRRAVNCDPVDTLAFSPDGSILVGTTLNCKTPTTVMVSAQHFSTDLPVEGLAQLWTTQVLFPRSSRDSSHASLLPEEDDRENTWTFTYDRVYEMFRAVRVDDLRNGHTYFTGPSDENGAVAPTTLPAPTGDGRMVAAGFSGKVWIYGVPRKLELPAETPSQDGDGSNAPSRSNSTSGRAPNWVSGQLGTIVMPQWQVLCDKMRGPFIGGREIGDVHALSGIKFVKCSNGTERLVAVAGGGVDGMLGEGGEEEFLAIGGGRVVLYDLGRTPKTAEKTIITIEIGDGIQGPVETLEEQHNDIEVEVDIVRRRTVAQKRDNDRRRSMRPQGAPESSHSNNYIPPIPRLPAALHSSAPPRTSPGPVPVRRQRTFDEEDESTEPIDLPYSQGEPRSRTTLHRAATAARNTPQPATGGRYARALGPDGRPVPQNVAAPQQTRHDDGSAWVPPPPPYTPRNEDNLPLPEHLLMTLQGPPRVTEPYVLNDQLSPSPSRSMTTLQRTRTTIESTVGNMMRRPSAFRPTVNTGASQSHLSIHPNYSAGNIAQSRSAPVSPAVGMPPSVFQGPRTGPLPGSTLQPQRTYVANQQRHNSPQPQQSHGRRGSAGDALNFPNVPPIPAMYRENSAPLPQQQQQQTQSRQPPPIQTSPPSQPPHTAPPPRQYRTSMLSPGLPPGQRDSPNYRAMPTRRPSPARSASRGRRVALQESYVAGAPTTGTGGLRRGMSTTRGGSVRSNGGSRRGSRAQRSAAINVRDRRRRQEERAQANEGRKRGGACIIC
ncbi:uncharacterized protein LAJ45_02549 [Morchella importuna]|uniref:uncharacterized protein n=1 Tax=Morchella importuna TaxID=1174673 RepID=UPI001E8D70FD|nr:uncharacterized protein LAJ45_02549 [Morchella importuna]KAH8153736.1 hypothetical protein LAJ45_02549 [Morchella importuna]